MNKVTTLDKNTRLRIALTKAAETGRAMAERIQNPTTRARLVAKANEALARARAL